MEPTEQFRHHHAELLQQFQQIRGRLDDGTAPLSKLTEYFRENVLPHARAEESVLYTMIDSLAESHLATATMRREHDHICELLESLEAGEENGHDRVDQTLAKLDEVFANHFEKEEEILLPFLASSLTDEKFNELLEETHRLEREASDSGG